MTIGAKLQERKSVLNLASLSLRPITSTTSSSPMQETHLSEIINGKRRITPDIAEKLENALGIRAITWTNLQNGYDYDCKQKQSNSEAKIEANKSLLIREILNIKDNAALEKLSAYIKSIRTSESH